MDNLTIAEWWWCWARWERWEKTRRRTTGGLVCPCLSFKVCFLYLLIKNINKKQILKSNRARAWFSHWLIGLFFSTIISSKSTTTMKWNEQKKKIKKWKKCKSIQIGRTKIAKKLIWNNVLQIAKRGKKNPWKDVYAGSDKLAAPAPGNTNAFSYSNDGHIIWSWQANRCSSFSHDLG